MLVAALAAGCAFAQEGKHPDDKAHAEEKANPNEIYWKWANFAILVARRRLSREEKPGNLLR